MNGTDYLQFLLMQAGHVNMLKNKIYKYLVTHRCKKNGLVKCFLFCLNQPMVAFQKYIILTRPNITSILQIAILRKNNTNM